MDNDFHRTFTKCPCCGSEERFLEQLGDEMKERGLAKDEWAFHMDVREGIVVDKDKADAIPIGSEVPVFGFMTDICMECGCVYAVDLTRRDTRKPAPPLPDRAQRHRDVREGGGQLLNPFSKS